jgi:hypothetical protein
LSPDTFTRSGSGSIDSDAVSTVAQSRLRKVRTPYVADYSPI